MKRFIRKILFAALPVLAALIVVNYYGDAARLFDNNYEKEIADILKSGKYVTNISNYDERIFQKEVIKNFKSCPDVVILGSSRTLLIKPEYLENQPTFNNSVSGASIEDLVAIYQMYKARNMLPKKIILGIDPWTFNKNNGQKRWQSLMNEYYSFFNEKKDTKAGLYTKNKKYAELLSPSYFQSSLKNIPAIIHGNRNPKPTTETHNKANTKLTDGSLVYSEEYRDASASDIEAKVKTYLSGSIYGIEKFDSLSTKAIESFNLLIKDIQVNNIEIIFFLAPYHPIVYDAISKNYQMVIKAEEYVLKYSAINNIKVYGSFDPGKAGLIKSDFYDGMHCKENAIKTILNNKPVN